MPTTRRDARERALQFLYQRDLNSSQDLDRALACFWEQNPAPAEARRYAQTLVHGVERDRHRIDERIMSSSEHWEMRRMGVIDRNVMRIAVYEMLHMPDVPPVVSINEAVDLAKYFSSRESGKFVNGVLDRIRKGLPRPAREAMREDPA